MPGTFQVGVDLPTKFCSLVFTRSVPAAEKLDEQLFFVHNESAPGGDDPSKTAKEEEEPAERLTAKRRKRSLKTDMYQQPNSAVGGFPVRKRRLAKKYKKLSKAIETAGEDGRLCGDEKKTGAGVDSSSEDDELDRTTSYTEMRHQRLAKLKETAKQNPTKSVHRTVMKDLWADGE